MAEERELKLAVRSVEDLTRLLAELPAPSAIVEQRNHYFVDPEGQTRADGVMVRLRETQRRGAAAATSVRLTLKRKRSVEAGVFLSEEIEDDVPTATWEAVRDGRVNLVAVDVAPIRDLVAQLGLTSLQHQVTMTNVRRVIEVQGYTLEVDHTRFTNRAEEGEVECETEDPAGARRLIDAAAARAGVRLVEQDRSKYARLLAYLAAEAGTE